MAAAGVSKQADAIRAECEEKGLAYCKGKAELSFGARRQVLLDWIGKAESQVKAREKAISHALEMQQAEEAAQAARKSARRVMAFAIAAAMVVAIILLMHFKFSVF